MALPDGEDPPPSFFDDYPDVDRRSCQLLGPTALVVQGLMGILVILSLVFKRHRETPKRPWRIWSFDVSKQVIGQMFVHGVNILVSDVVAHHSSGNPCVLYFLNILIDTTFGVGIIYVVHHSLTYIFTEKLQMKGFQSGQYGDLPSFWYWGRQAVVYVVALTTMKMTVVALLVLWPGIFKIGDWLLHWTGGGDTVQVVFVMGIFPIMMNIIQFWLIDSIVKASSRGVALPTETPRNSADHEPLIRDGSDDDDDDGGYPATRHDIEAPAESSSTLRRSPTLTGDENKSNSTVSGGRSVAPGQYQDSMTSHTYPPRHLSSSGSSSRSQSLDAANTSLKQPRPKRIPPPLVIASAILPVLVSSSQTTGASIRDKLETLVHGSSNHLNDAPRDDAAEWSSTWHDDDWAEKVGDDDLTHRRLQARHKEMTNVWMNTPYAIEAQ